MRELEKGSRDQRRAVELFRERMWRQCAMVDRSFAALMVCQWVAALLIAFTMTPSTWSGTESSLHPHVWLVLWFGPTVMGLAVLAALIQPGRTSTRHIMAATQALVSGLLIHISGGRIEAHFHIFGSLAFLAAYRDWRVLATASAVVAVDHFVRGIYFPVSVFGSAEPGDWRWIEHVAWVIFEDVFLFIAIYQSQREMLAHAEQQASLEQLNEAIEEKIVQRTRELAAEVEERRRTEIMLRETEQRFQQIANHIEQVFWIANRERTESLYLSPAFELIWGRDAATALATSSDWLATVLPEDRQTAISAAAANAAGERTDVEFRIRRPDGTVRWIRERAVPMRSETREIVGVCGLSEDITEQKNRQAELFKLERQVRDASRQIGIAEVATSVLHNVGNVLNSVTVSSSTIARKVSALRVQTLRRVSDLLWEHAQNATDGFLKDDPQGKRLPKFMSDLADHFRAKQEEMVAEVHDLQRWVEHIKQVIAMQQSHVTAGALFESVPVNDLIDDALRLEGSALLHRGFAVERELDPNLPSIQTDRNKVLLILVNVIRNAREACEHTVAARKFLMISSRLTPEGQVRISLRDNGVGIRPENLQRIFSHGFTTRKDGHGFGLHSCALAAAELKGNLVAESEGEGLGATFHLTLPVAPTGESDAKR